MIGIGSMLHELGGGSPQSADNYYGKKIKNANFTGDVFYITFEDGVKIKIWDDGQSCCESRYMTCDDDTTSLQGKTLVAIEVKYADSKEDEENNYDAEHEIAFLDIKTNDNVVTFATHNEHNGYYGGFGLSIDEVKDE